MKKRFHQQQLSRYTSFELFLCELLDQFLILFIVSPGAVLVWRGSWKFFDEFLFPEYLLISSWVSVGIGYVFIIITFLFVEVKGGNLKLFEKYNEWRFFMYPLSISVLHAWRGVWMLLDIYSPMDGYSLLISHVLSFVVLGLTKTVSNSMFIPAFYASDYCVTPFQIGTAFGTANTRTNPFYKLFDYIFTMTVITISTVSFWRSTWTALNVYVFPNHEAFSNFISIIVGYTIIVSFKLVEGSLKALAECSKVITFILQAAFCYSMGFAAINLWRGLWQMIDIYVYPDHPIPVSIISHCLGMVILYISRSVVNLIGCPCGTRVDSLETLSAFDTTVGSVIHLSNKETIENDPEKDEEHATKKKLIVRTSSDVDHVYTTSVVK